MSFFSHHIFVCQNEREAGHSKGSCKARGGEGLVEAFRSEMMKEGLSPACRVNQSGCLGRCSIGPTVVIYPEGTWYGHVTVEDVPEIVRALKEGRIVERLKV